MTAALVREPHQFQGCSTGICRYLRRGGGVGDLRRRGGGAGEGERRLLAGGGEGLLLRLPLNQRITVDF